MGYLCELAAKFDENEAAKSALNIHGFLSNFSCIIQFVIYSESHC